MGVPNGGPKWGSQMVVPNGAGVQIRVPYRGPISPSVLKCPNVQMIKWPNDQMTKCPNVTIEGVNVLKVIPRPTALRDVGKNIYQHMIGARPEILDQNHIL
jgi:hypothetical protein